jgi:hypothetical protein
MALDPDNNIANSPWTTEPAPVVPGILTDKPENAFNYGFENNTQEQANIRATDNDASDWRFRVRLAAGSQVLYKSSDSGILDPLKATDGVIFPYTPQVMINYQANYNKTTPTHSNYAQYFYQSSEISDIQITGTFTAQSTKEADYLLAAIHFFRSATKMFYGQLTLVKEEYRIMGTKVRCRGYYSYSVKALAKVQKIDIMDLKQDN